MSTIFTPLSNDGYRIPRAQVLFKRAGSDRFVNLGDVESFNVTPELTEIERYSKEYSTRVKTFSAVVQKNASISMTLMHLTDTARAMLFMTDVDGKLVQSAVADGEVTFENVAAGDIFDLGARDVTVSAVTDGEVAPVSYTLGTHYKVDRRTGKLEIIAVPGTAGDDVKIEFTAPAITANDKRWMGGLMKAQGVRGTVFVRGLSDLGANEEASFWDVEFRPSGDIAMQGEDDVANIEVSGQVYADGTRPAGFELGEIAVIPKTALV